MYLPLNVLKKKKKCGWSFHMLVNWPPPVYVGGSWLEYELDFMPIIEQTTLSCYVTKSCTNVGRYYFSTF